jgi:hypothetical protein
LEHATAADQHKNSRQDAVFRETMVDDLNAFSIEWMTEKSGFSDVSVGICRDDNQ